MSPVAQPVAGVTHVSFDHLVDLLSRVFLNAGVPPENSRILGINCASCERDGAHSHGVFRIPGYLGSLNSGWVDGAAVPLVHDLGAAFIRVDARNGFAQPALEKARPLLIEKVRNAGVAVLAIRDSHHFSALWPDVEPFAMEGLVALTFVAGSASVVPFGGTKPVYGTNPFAFAAPVAGLPPIVFDQASSSMANGEVRIAAREGRALPPDSGIDREGRPTVDPNAVLDGGALLTFGGHKGASIALLVEVMAAALTGGHFSAEVDFAGHDGAETPKTGQLFIALDPTFGGNSAFPSRTLQLVNRVREAGQVRLPGDRRLAARLAAEKDGIPLNSTELATLIRLAGG